MISDTFFDKEGIGHVPFNVKKITKLAHRVGDHYIHPDSHNYHNCEMIKFM